MSDLLEKTIRENRELLEAEAPTGHFERFEDMLENKFGKREKFKKKRYLQIAATIFIVLLGANQVRISLISKTKEPTGLSNVSPEYKEVEFYYTSTINQGLREWENLIQNGYIPAEEQLLLSEEIKEFDDTYARLKQELGSNPNDDRVINAMLEMYQSKLSVITLIIQKLENIKRQNQLNNETES